MLTVSWTARRCRLQIEALINTLRFFKTSLACCQTVLVLTYTNTIASYAEVTHWGDRSHVSMHSGCETLQTANGQKVPRRLKRR